jgi:hypothetical protein
MRVAGAGIVALSLLAVAGPAHAEIGVPVKRGGVYLSIEGGYQNGAQTSPVAAQGASQVNDGVPGAVSGAQGNATGSDAFGFFAYGGAGYAGAGGFGAGAGADALAGAISGSELAIANPNGGSFIEAEDGGYGGATFGYALTSPLLGVVTRIEARGSVGRIEEDQRSFGALGMRSVDNRAMATFVTVPIENFPVSVDQSVSKTEFALSFKADQAAGPSSLTFAAEPFYIAFDQNTRTSGASTLSAQVITEGSASRRSDVEADLYGLQLAVEGAAPIGGPFSLIARGSAGVYHANAEGSFDSAFGMANQFGSFAVRNSVDADASQVGYRLGGEAGVRVDMGTQGWLSITGAVDYLSETPTAVLPREAGDAPARVAFDDSLDWRLGVRMTFFNQ